VARWKKQKKEKIKNITTTNSKRTIKKKGGEWKEVTARGEGDPYRARGNKKKIK
jgi:hypothetical protein